MNQREGRRQPDHPVREGINMVETQERTERWHRYWDKKSRSYDREMRFTERVLFGDSRRWACSQAIGRDVELRQGDAHALPFAEATFDAVVCTFGLCAIPDIDKALDEMFRVLRPGGKLILVDHVASSSRVARGIQ